MLTSELRWIMKVAEHAELTILGKQVVLPNLNVVAAVRLEQRDVDEVKAALQRGDAAGMELISVAVPVIVCMFLRDRFPAISPPLSRRGHSGS